MNTLQNLRFFIKQTARELGFDYCGIAKAEKLDADARRLENWLSKGYQAGMQYMENHFDLRIDPTRLVPGAKSVITLIKNYYPADRQSPGVPGIAKYAYGHDYHEVIRGQLRLLLEKLREKTGAIQGRGFVDSAPVLERSWAQRSGLGWIGKNANLLTKKSGSFFFIATLITDLAVEADDPFAHDYCGSCTRCIDHCPTGAILPGKTIDSTKCISYYTIELKEMLIPAEWKGKFDNWIFGCDTCQDVCPWNRFASPHHEKEFEPIPGILGLTIDDWQQMTEERFKQMFRLSPLRRAKYEGLQRNLRLILQKEDPVVQNGVDGENKA